MKVYIIVDTSADVIRGVTFNKELANGICRMFEHENLIVQEFPVLDVLDVLEKQFTIKDVQA